MTPLKLDPTWNIYSGILPVSHIPLDTLPLVPEKKYRIMTRYDGKAKFGRQKFSLKEIK